MVESESFNPSYTGDQIGAYVEPVAESGLMPIDDDPTYGTFQSMLANYLLENPGFWSDRVVKKLLQNLRDVAKDELAHATPLDKPRIAGLKRYLNGVIIWLTRRSRLENFNRILPLLTENQSDMLKHTIMTLAERDLGLEDLPSEPVQELDLIQIKDRESPKTET